ncbi:TFIIS N-terminal domain-containing protein [Trichostrongylus colubriformis]|uniref:TFIIS N-terminal domain-containing protein n=1 Tax=Trichostrongylus colubriformis TaxID=6319 RepID=A0AAN8FSH0_TRICO
MDDDASSLNGQASPSVGDGSVSPFVGASPDYQEQGSSPGNDSAVASPSHASASVASSPAYKEQDDDSGDEFNADSPNVPGSPEADPITGNGDVTEAYEPTPSLPEGPLSSPTALSPQHGEDSHSKSPQQREEDGEDEKRSMMPFPMMMKEKALRKDRRVLLQVMKVKVTWGYSGCPKKNLLDSDDSDDELDEEQRKKKLGNLIVNIFGEDIDEDAEGGHDDDDEQDEKQQEEANQEDEDDYVRDRSKDDGRDRAGFEWDFDLMLREKKAERKKKRKRRDAGIDIINDDDGVIAHMVNAMKNAAKDDRHSNTERKPALKKRKMLHDVKMMLLRMDMLEAMIDGGMMSAVSEWLAPLPDKSLPALEIRTELLKILSGFGNLDQGVLKQSGLGRAVMLLYKHPRETKENKAMAAQIIREWSRPIFQLDTDFRSVSREERLQRDLEHMSHVKKRRMSQWLTSKLQYFLEIKLNKPVIA